jgi:hypothetical protein
MPFRTYHWGDRDGADAFRVGRADDAEFEFTGTAKPRRCRRFPRRESAVTLPLATTSWTPRRCRRFPRRERAALRLITSRRLVAHRDGADAFRVGRGAALEDATLIAYWRPRRCRRFPRRERRTSSRFPP